MTIFQRRTEQQNKTKQKVALKIRKTRKTRRRAAVSV
jgi:hypothetical protein